ncbi:baseplate J/gp47 family protein [Cupriavidus oxalaticus]|uniref:Baseplate J/gp47 family protein n=1 Tax=Cupriavidus oxalaticus TaxID=96344 RepID=A0A4P7LMU3_9BURK|nr:baseplate J/gp47 family protein [Cupriavidus oxalaticus]QBY56159.1 baseplate J/gp47 family protein [Cupriavidus oxalaticus]
MPFELPTLPKLIERADADLSSKSQDALRRSDQQALTRVHSGATFGLYGYLGWVARQILPDTCDDDMVLRYAALRLKNGRLAAVSAAGTVRCTGQVGSVVDVGVLMQTNNGRRYQVTEAATLGVDGAVVKVQAVEAGTDGNLTAGTVLTMVSPVLGVADQVTVLAPGLTGGTPQESIEGLRQRVLRSYQVVPQGGSASDYVTWALEVPGVTRAWCLSNYIGRGTVGVLFVRDGDADPIPDALAVASVQAHIDEVRPVTALEAFVVAPQPHAIHYQLRVTPDTTAVREAVEANLRALHARGTEPGATLLRTHMDEAISLAEGETDHELLSPAADVTVGRTELPVFGSVAWL